MGIDSSGVIMRLRVGEKIAMLVQGWIFISLSDIVPPSKGCLWGEVASITSNFKTLREKLRDNGKGE